jgi:hypothetical protein
VAALHQGEQLGATAHLLQTSHQVLLLVAAQAVAVGQVSLETQATEEMVGLTAAQVAVVAQVLTALAILVLVAMEQTAS